MSPTVLNISTCGRNLTNSVYIGRPGKWGNPYHIGKDGDRDEVCDKYEKWIMAPEQADLRQQAKKELRGKNLVCYCHPLRCHGDKLLEVSNEPDVNTIVLDEAPNKSRVNVLTDGIDHINIYSKGKTQLGRDLSNFSEIGFDHPQYGRFASVEAFYYFCSTGHQHAHLKTLYGFKAKQEGKLLERVDNPKLLDEIEEAIKLRFYQNPWLLQQFKVSTLPFKHYYIGGEGFTRYPIFTWSSTWLEYFYNKLRDQECGRLEGPGLKLIVAGSRTINDYDLVCRSIMDSKFNILEIVSGHAIGVDQLGERFAKERNIPVKIFKPDWYPKGKEHGFFKVAGFVRNKKMGDYADALVAIIDNQSHGTTNMLEYMKKLCRMTYVVRTINGIVQNA
ncbi:MAG TPA: DUF4326 domain-containing protein [Anaerolineales bacterium]|nr:DUF4326 domain-containing protein [Anaerolineales bacterium]